MIIQTSEQMEQLGEAIGTKLHGGEVIELVGDVGAGKTTFTRGLARGLGITDNVTSPSFTISCNYNGRDNLTLCHYDFYRLNDAGIIAMEIAESINNPTAISIVEWADNIRDILPTNRVTIAISYLPTSGRDVQISTSEKFSYLQP